VTSPIVSGACPYTSHSIVETGSLATSTLSPGTTTLTNYDGSVQECTAFRQVGNGVPDSICLGPTVVSAAPVMIETTPTPIGPSATSIEPSQVSAIPTTRSRCDHKITRDGNMWTVEGRGWTTHDLKRHVQACDSPKHWEQTMLTNDPDGLEFRLTFQMNPDYDVCIRDEIEGTAKC
jgi:hypothetical protein